MTEKQSGPTSPQNSIAELIFNASLLNHDETFHGLTFEDVEDRIKSILTVSAKIPWRGIVEKVDAFLDVPKEKKDIILAELVFRPHTSPDDESAWRYRWLVFCLQTVGDPTVLYYRPVHQVNFYERVTIIGIRLRGEMLKNLLQPVVDSGDIYYPSIKEYPAQYIMEHFRSN